MDKATKDEEEEKLYGTDMVWIIGQSKRFGQRSYSGGEYNIK